MNMICIKKKAVIISHTSFCVSLLPCGRSVWEGEGEREGELPTPELPNWSGKAALSLVGL